MNRRALLLLAAFPLASCATVLHGRNETISVDSSPPAAAVNLKCAEVTRTGTTPAAITIPRNATDCVITVSAPGYRTKTIALGRSVSRAYWLNLIGLAALPLGISDTSPVSISGEAGLALVVSGGVGLGIDALDGAMFRHEPAASHVVLEPDRP